MSGPSSQWYSEDDQRVVHALDLLQESGRRTLSSLPRHILTIVSPLRPNVASQRLPAAKRAANRSFCSFEIASSTFQHRIPAITVFPIPYPVPVIIFTRVPMSRPSDHLHPKSGQRALPSYILLRTQQRFATGPHVAFC